MDLLKESFKHGDHDHDHDPTEQETGIPTYGVKIITMVSLMIGSLIIGMAPYFLSKYFKWFAKDGTSTDGDGSGLVKHENPIVVFLLAFGGGVLLSTTFIHLLPEVHENVQQLQGNGSLPEMTISLAPLLMCAGFFFLFLIEEMTHLYLSKHEKQSKLVRTLSIRKNDSLSSTDSTKSDVEKVDVRENGKKQENGMVHSHEGHSHAVINVSGLRGMLIVMALSVHELFEGLAIGLEATTANVWYLFGAVASHKFVISFCVGMALLQSNATRLKYIANISVFSVVSPVGIGIGILLMNIGDDSIAVQITSVFFQGLATGTLLYVIFFDILKQGSRGLLQWVASLIGFSIMTLVQFAGGHGHSHGGPNNDCHSQGGE